MKRIHAYRGAICVAIVAIFVLLAAQHYLPGFWRDVGAIAGAFGAYVSHRPAWVDPLVSNLKSFAMGLKRGIASQLRGPAPLIDRRGNQTMLFNFNWQALLGSAVGQAVPDSSLVGDLAGVWLAGRIGGVAAQQAAAAAHPQIAPYAAPVIELLNGNVKGALVQSGVTGDDIDALAQTAIGNLTSHLVQGTPPAEQAIASLTSLALGGVVGQSLSNAYNHIVTGGASTVNAAKPAAA